MLLRNMNFVKLRGQLNSSQGMLEQGILARGERGPEGVACAGGADSMT